MAAFRATRLANFAAAAATVRVALARPAARVPVLTAQTPMRRTYSTARPPPPPSPNPANLPARGVLLRAVVKEIFRLPTPQEYFERGFRLAIVLGPFVGIGSALTITVVDVGSTRLFSPMDVFALSYGTGVVFAALVLVGHSFMFPVAVAASAGAFIHYAYGTTSSTPRRRSKAE